MFGEKEIVGQTIIRIKKNKIVIPEFTGVEPGEILYSTIDIYQKKILIMKEKDFLKRLKELEEKIEQGRENRIINSETYRNLQRYIWGILCLHDRKITQKKEYMLFSNKFEDGPEQRQIRRLNFKDEVFAVGVKTHLEIYPSEAAYQEDISLQKTLK